MKKLLVRLAFWFLVADDLLCHLRGYEYTYIYWEKIL